MRGRIVVALLLATLVAPAALLPGRSVSAATPRVAPRALPAGFSFGLANGPGEASWMTSSGVPWTYRYAYLSAGVNTGNGWETWNQPAGQYATYYMTDSASNDPGLQLLRTAPVQPVCGIE